MKEYKLKNPIVLGDETIEVLKLSPPRRIDIERSPFSLKKIQEDMDLVECFNLVEAACRNATSAHIDLMDTTDITGAVEVCSDFF